MANDRNNSNQDMDQKRSGNSNPGNFKNNPERAREAGRKGGEASHGGGRRSE